MMRLHCARFSSRSNYASHSNLDQSPQDFVAIGPHSYFQRIRKTDQEYEGRARVRLHSCLCLLSHNPGPSSFAAPPTLNPAPQKSAAPETTSTEPPGPLPPLPTPSSKDLGSSSPLHFPDPHLHHQMRVLLKQIQDMRVILGHLVMELRDLSSHLKLQATKDPAKY